MNKQWENCKAVVQQIKAGEWTPVYNPISGECLTAVRGDQELWLGSTGPWHLDFCQKKNAFGWMGRHYVYWVAARELKRQADKEARALKIGRFAQ